MGCSFSIGAVRAKATAIRPPPAGPSTPDGLELKGWYVPSSNRAAVIVFPGKKGTQRHARMLVRPGYGVLVFDRRGEGQSDRHPTAPGWTFDPGRPGAEGLVRAFEQPRRGDRVSRQEGDAEARADARPPRLWGARFRSAR